MLDILADDLILLVVQHWLNPRDERTFSITCQRFYCLLPPPLRVRICSFGKSASTKPFCWLGGDLFVSPVEVEGESIAAILTTGNSKVSSATKEEAFSDNGRSSLKPTYRLSEGPMLPLEFQKAYCLWRFDYEENCPVYLGRHLRQTLRSDNDSMQHRYTLAFHPQHPNQSWKILPANVGSQSQSSRLPRQRVPWNVSVTSSPTTSAVQFVVSGTDFRSGQTDSTEEHWLTAQARSNHDSPLRWTWFVTDEAAAKGNLPKNQPCQLVRSSTRPATPFAQAQPSPTFPLATHAISEISDKGAYLVYHPSQWKPHLSPCKGKYPGGLPSRRDQASLEGRDAVIDFIFWQTKGVLHIKAHLLPFTLAIPIMTLDRQHFRKNKNPIPNLFESYSARWGCIKYYMATAADVREGSPLAMATFLRGVTDHDEHAVVYSSLSQVVHVSMKGAVDTELPDVPKDNSQVWKFFFSW